MIEQLHHFTDLEHSGFVVVIYKIQIVFSGAGKLSIVLAFR